MSKWLLLLISFFNLSSIIVSNESLNDFIFVYEESENTDVIYKDGAVELSGTTDNYKLIIDKETILYRVKDAKVMVKDDNVYLFYLEQDHLKYDVFSMKGREISKENTITSNAVISYNVVKGLDEIYIYYNSTYGENIDSYIVKVIENKKLDMSTAKDEEVKDLVIDGENLYIVVKKDAITEGIFGNGGLDKAIVIAKFDGDLRLIKYITMDDEEDNQVRSIDVKGGVVYLYKESSIHLFSSELESINNKKLGKNHLTISDYDGCIYSFLQEKIEVFNPMSLSLSSVIEYPFDISRVERKDKCLFVYSEERKYKTDIIDCRSLHSYKYLVSENSERYNQRLNSLKSLFGSVRLVDKEYSDYHSPGYFGLFDVTLKYSTISGISFGISVKENVPLEDNLRDRMIYPAGYRVRFNGDGLINGNAMLSNYQIKDDGIYEIEINGKNERKNYTIHVDHNQKGLNGEVNYVIDDYEELPKNQKFSMFFNLNRNLNIKNIQVEGFEIDSFNCENSVLTVVFNGKREPGYYYLYIDYLDYEDVVNDDLSTTGRYYLNQEYWFHISKDLPTISNGDFLDDMSYSFDLIDNDDVARYIEFELTDLSHSYLVNIPLGSAPITFSNVPSGNYELRAFVVYDNNSENTGKIKLFDYTIRLTNDNLEYGELKVSKESSKYTKITVEIDEKFLKNSVNEIEVNKEIIYSHQDTSSKTVIVYSVAGFIASFLVGFGCRYIYKRVKKKDNVA